MLSVRVSIFIAPGSGSANSRGQRGSRALQTTASTPKFGIRAEDTPTPCVHKRCRDALHLPLSFKLTAVVLTTAVVRARLTPPGIAASANVPGALAHSASVPQRSTTRFQRFDNRVHVEHAASPGAARCVLERGPQARVVRQLRVRFEVEGVWTPAHLRVAPVRSSVFFRLAN